MTRSWQDVRDEYLRWWVGPAGDPNTIKEVSEWKTILSRACKRVAALEHTHAGAAPTQPVAMSIDIPTDIDRGHFLTTPRYNQLMEAERRLGKLLKVFYEVQYCVPMGPGASKETT